MHVNKNPNFNTTLFLPPLSHGTSYSVSNILTSSQSRSCFQSTEHPMNTWNLPPAVNITSFIEKCRSSAWYQVTQHNLVGWMPVIFHTSRQWLQWQTGLQGRKDKTAGKWRMSSFEQFSRLCKGAGNSSSDWPLKRGRYFGMLLPATSTWFKSIPLKLLK